MFGDSRALFTDSNAIFSSNSNPKGEDMLTKSRMNFDMSNNSSIQDYKQYQNNQTNSGLLRFRSAPSSLFANFDNGVDKSGDSNEDLMAESFKGLDDNKSLPNGFAVNSQLPPHYPRHSSNLGLGTQVGAMDNSSSYRMGSSMGMENQAKMVSSLMRQNSSPAGLFSHLNSQTGYAAMRGGVGNYRLGNGSNGDISPTSSRLKSQMSFSSGLPSSLGMLSRISEIEVENIGATGNDDAKNGSGNHGDTQFYTSEFPLSSWSDSLHFAENFTGLKRELNDDDEKLFSGAQNTDLANHPPLLSHHLSLPKTSSEMAAMDKLLQFQDSVPCKIRAKRGCATHPRSIAERVRRTRISERMRKLQELVPHMDKQTNTADMLDLAVEYIKDLQKQFKALSDNRANCKCSGMQKAVFN